MAESSASVYSPQGHADEVAAITSREHGELGNASSTRAIAASERKQDFLRTEALSHDDRFLSPKKAAQFDVDRFLVSRATGSTLNEIAAELQMFGGRLRHELDEVVDRDFRGFVNLGVALKAERPRIARLDWRGDERRQQGERRDAEEELADIHTSDRVKATEMKSPANLGLDRVRNELLSIRDGLRDDERNVRASMSERQRIEEAQANMQVLITFDESLCRLEDLLPSDTFRSSEDNIEVVDGASVDEYQRRFWDAFDVMESEDKADDEDSMSSSSEYNMSIVPNGEAKGEISTIKNHKRRTSVQPDRKGRRRSSLALLSANLVTHADTLGPSMTLPERIQRASSEHSALTFLQKQARDKGFSEYLEAHTDRLTAVRIALKQDLALLVRALTQYDGTSLLVPGPRELTVEQDSLDAWSKFGRANLAEKKEEQISWLQLALSTWSSLTPIDSATATEISEVEEEIRSSLIEPWCDAHISSAALQDSTKLFVNENSSSAADVTLPSNLALVDGKRHEKGTALIRLYNTILTYVHDQASEICTVAEELNARTNEGSHDHCELFVHSVWREVATRLMERIGGQIFFVGRPDDFRINYTISMAFLEAFERLAPSPRAARALQEDAVYATFKKRWQLSVYFQMRFRDIVTTFESTVQSTPVELNTEGLSPITIAALNAFASPWTAKSHIAELGHRQWRLSLQIVSRYKTWIQTVLPVEILPAHRRVTDAARHQSSSSIEQQRFGSATQSTINSPVRSGTPTGNDVDHENHLMDMCTSASNDVLHFQSEILRLFRGPILSALQQSIKDETDEGFTLIASRMREALESSLSSLVAQVVPLCASKVTTILKSRSAEPLRLVRSVSTQYRTSSASANGGQPSSSYEPSFFVVQFLRPVRQYLGAVEKVQQRGVGGAADVVEKCSARLPKATREQWIGEVIEDFVVRYTASLTTMSKNFESLQRLKRVNAVGSTDGGKAQSNTQNSSTSESERMYAQMMADVEHFERSVHELGTEVNTDIATETLAWRKLKAASRGEQTDE